MSAAINAGTRLIALLGNPVSHSLSPVFQNAAIREAGLDAVYVALRCEESAVLGLLRGIASAGGGGNVTVPHKRAAAAAIDEPSDAVIRTGACNTYWLEEGRVFGDNTDVEGVGSAVKSLLGRDPEGARVLLIGAGGSAGAAIAAMLDRRAAEIVIANRTPERAEALLAGFPSTPAIRLARLEALQTESFDLVINATSLGLRRDDPFPLALEGGPRVDAALDLVYSAGSTPWVRALRERGIPAADGVEMLILQGAASFERWWRIPAPVEAMRDALVRAGALGA